MTVCHVPWHNLSQVAQTRGEFVLLELEEKALKAITRSFDSYERAPGDGVPMKLIEALTMVHKMVMQRMNAKYGLDKNAPDLEQILAALDKEKALVTEMLSQKRREEQLQ